MHPNKHIRAAIKYALEHGFTIDERVRKSHTKVVLKCEPGCCIINISGTPRNPETHAKQIRRAVDNCQGVDE